MGAELVVTGAAVLGADAEVFVGVGLGPDADGGVPPAAVDGDGESDSSCMASARLSVQVVLLAQTRPLGYCRPTKSSRPFMSSCIKTGCTFTT